MAESNNSGFTDSERHQITEKLEKIAKKGLRELQNYLKEMCDEWKNTKIRIGVIGESHSGKSSFINTMRGLRSGDPGAAEAKNRECTRELTQYPYPKNPLLTLWDLPGVGTNNFPRETYLDKMNVSRYDFLLILSKDSFSELDTWLASELGKAGKGYFFVRTFMDRALEEEEFDKHISIKEKDLDGNPTEEMKKFMSDMRNYCAEGLQFTNQMEIPIYLVSNWYPERFEFPELILSISKRLPDIQKKALLLATKLGTEKIYQAKKEILKKRALFVALLSGAVGAMPIPGTGLIVDVPVVIKEVKFYKEQFNLDAPNLNTGDKKRKDFMNTIASVGTNSYVIGLLAKSALSDAVQITAQVLSWVSVGITSVLSAATSFGSTYYILTTEIDKIAELSKTYLDLRVEAMMR